MPADVSGENAAVTVTAKGTAPFTIACAATALSACTGVIFIDPAPAAKAKGKKAKKRKACAKKKAKRKARRKTARRR
jgi:hypothetical protein